MKASKERKQAVKQLLNNYCRQRNLNQKQFIAMFPKGSRPNQGSVSQWFMGNSYPEKFLPHIANILGYESVRHLQNAIYDLEGDIKKSGGLSAAEVPSARTAQDVLNYISKLPLSHKLVAYGHLLGDLKGELGI